MIVVRKILLFASTALVLVNGAVAFALEGDIQFSAEEKERHLRALPQIISVTTDSMKAFAKLHFETHASCGLGLLYGFKSGYSKLTSKSAKEHWLVSRAKCANPPRVEDVNITSCEIYTNRHLEKGFAAVGQSDLFARITDFFDKNQRSGIALAYALSKLGWKTVYWNTDAAVRHPSPEDRKKIGQTPDDHVYGHMIARKKGVYYGVPLNGFMTNFAPSEGSSTQADKTGLNAFMKVPYFIGIAHGGFHVFPGYMGTVNESHSPYNPENKKNIELGTFGPPFGAPMGLTVTEGGQHRMAYYHSGILVMPPGDWIWF